MSSGAPIVVRYDAQNSEKVVGDTNKIVGSLNALRTASGQTATSVKQMEAGFSSNALGNFSNAVTNADSRISGFRTKLAGIGSQFSQNATSFGVATASIWGVYNAYDSLEKVQIRANAAATRVATLETTIATLTQRRAEAVANGNLSAEEMAILDERITNGHAKLAVAQQRNADLQGDVNEAWAGFASQVGPQAVAAGGAVIQLVTNLRGSMGGVIPSIRNFFGSITGGTPVMAQARNQSLLLGQGIGNLPGPMNAAAGATRGLSVAMKGLLIGSGVGIAIAAIGLIAEHFTNTAEAAEVGSEDIEGSLDEMDSSFSGSEGSVKQWGGTVHKMVDGTVIVVKDAASQVKESLSGLAQSLRNEFPGLTPEFISGKNTEIEGQISELQGRKAALKGGAAAGPGFRSASNEIADIDAKIRLLNKDIAENKNLMDLMFGTASKGAADLNTLSESVDNTKTSVVELIDEGADLTTLFQKWQAGAMESSTPDLAQRYEMFKQGINNYTAGVKSAIPPTEDFVKWQQKVKEETFLAQFQTKAQADALEQEAEAEKEANRVKQEALAIKTQIVKETFGEVAATQQAGESNADYANRMSELSDIGQKRIDEEKAYTLGLIETAVSLGINVNQQAALTTAIGEGNVAILDLITSEQTLNEVLADSDRANRNLEIGLKQGRMEAVAWYDQMQQQIAANAQFKKDQDIIAGKFADALPAGIQLTKEQMEALIVSFDDTSKFALTLGETLNQVFSASRAAVQELVDAAAEGGKTWKDKWKDVKDLIPDELRDETKEFLMDQGEIAEKIDDVTVKVGLYRAQWDLFDKGDKRQATKDLVEDLEKMREQLDDITDVDVDAIFQPLIDLKKDGLTMEELNIWNGFFELYKRLKDEGGGISPEDVTALQEYVNNATGMGKLGDETEDTTTAFEDLDPAVQKIVVNNILARTIVQVTTNLETQKTAVENLTTAFEDLAEAKNSYTGGDGNSGFQFVSDDGIEFDPSFGHGDGENDTDTDKPNAVNVPFVADLTGWTTAIQQVKTDVETIDALAPIVDLLGDHRQFMKAGKDVVDIVSEIDKLRPIVDFLGDHRQFMKAGSDVVKVVKEIDALRPIVDFMGDHSNSGNFMDAADDVESRADEIDGRVVTVIFKAKRVGDFSAQHGMDMFMTEDATLAVHANEHVKVTPPGASVRESSSSPLAIATAHAGGIPKTLQAFIQINLDKNQVLTRLMREVPLEDTGMFPNA